MYSTLNFPVGTHEVMGCVGFIFQKSSPVPLRLLPPVRSRRENSSEGAMPWMSCHRSHACPCSLPMRNGVTLNRYTQSKIHTPPHCPGRRKNPIGENSLSERFTFLYFGHSRTGCGHWKPGYRGDQSPRHARPGDDDFGNVRFKCFRLGDRRYSRCQWRRLAVHAERSWRSQHSGRSFSFPKYHGGWFRRCHGHPQATRQKTLERKGVK